MKGWASYGWVRNDKHGGKHADDSHNTGSRADPCLSLTVAP